MKTAFLTEMGFTGKVPMNHPNMRTEFSWMATLGSDHYNIHQYELVKGYDAVFIIFPKGVVNLNAVGVEMTSNMPAKDMSIYEKPIMHVLKENNKKVCVVQEGPNWLFNDYDLPTQFNFYNNLAEADIIFSHNHVDMNFYKGLFPGIHVTPIPTLMIAPPVPEPFLKEEKAIIGGNFCRWYGGFQSFIIAREFDVPIYVPSSHCKRPGEEIIAGSELHHLPWVMWNQWMEQLKSFKYAVHLMPTVAAGTFALNCAYWGIPCIGNTDVDTQGSMFPHLSVQVDDLDKARKLAVQLKEDPKFYIENVNLAQYCLKNSFHFNRKKWLNYMEHHLNGESIHNNNREL